MFLLIPTLVVAVQNGAPSPEKCVCTITVVTRKDDTGAHLALVILIFAKNAASRATGIRRSTDGWILVTSAAHALGRRAASGQDDCWCMYMGRGNNTLNAYGANTYVMQRPIAWKWCLRGSDPRGYEGQVCACSVNKL